MMLSDDEDGTSQKKIEELKNLPKLSLNWQNCPSLY